MLNVFVIKSRIAFNQLFLIIFLITSLIIFVIYKIFQRVQLLAEIMLHKIQTACDCTQISQLGAMHPFITGLLLLSGIFLLMISIYLIYKFVRLARQTSKFNNHYLKHVKSKLSVKLSGIVKANNLEKNKIIELKEKEPVVFCAGLLTPKIFISSGLLKILAKDELEAVILHENQHAKSHDPLKLFIANFFQNIYFFLPLIKIYVLRYVTYAEMAADEQATNNFTDKPKLARAILKVSEKNAQYHQAAIALSLFTSTMEERVNRLTNDNYQPEFKAWKSGIFFAFALVSLFVMLSFTFLANSTKAFEMHIVGTCKADNTGTNQNVTCSKTSGDSCNVNNINSPHSCGTD